MRKPRSRFLVLWPLAFGLLGSSGVNAQSGSGFINDVVAYPDDTAATITWTTASPATSRVQYGRSSDLLELTTAETSFEVTNHAFLLTDLNPDTFYYFKAISTAGGIQYTSSALFFLTTNYITSTELFSLTHSWTYTVTNLDGIPWTSPTYDDSSWTGSGPGLFWVDTRGNGPNPGIPFPNTQLPANPENNGFPFITYYFRTHFTFTNDLSSVSLRFSCYLDDGAVFYLNGTEVQRAFMDPAPAEILNNTEAIGYNCSSGNADCPFEFIISGDLRTNLVSGDNVLAVEVHNYRTTSPDVTFGLDLSAPFTPRPTLNIQRSSGAVTLSWDRGGFILQAAADAAGPWNDVAGPIVKDPYSTLLSTGMRYFRLRR